MVKKIFPYLIIILLLIPLLWPLAQKGFFTSDDGEWMVIRLSAVHETLKTGQFPVRFVQRLNHGYGYPVMDFLYPLPFYLGEIIHLIGFSFVDSVKILFGLGWILGAVFMYLFASKEFGKLAGAGSAIVYSYLPYRVFDVYTRGSLGEAVAFIWPPLIFWLLSFQKKKTYILAAIATAALICSHNVLALLFLVVTFGYLIAKKIKIGILCLYFGISAAVSAWFWFPAIYDLQFTRAAQVSVSDFSKYFLSFDLLGVVTPLVLAVSIFLAVKLKKFETNYLIFILAASLFFTLPVSAIFWQLLPLPKLIQFPWRILAVSIFSTAVLCGYLVKTHKYFFVVAIVAIVNGLLVLKYNPVDREPGYYETNDDTTTVKNEYMPKWVKNDPTYRPSNQSTVYFPGHVETNFDENGVINKTGFVEFKETMPRLIADIVSLVTFGLCVILLFY